MTLTGFEPEAQPDKGEQLPPDKGSERSSKRRAVVKFSQPVVVRMKHSAYAFGEHRC